MTRRFSFSKLEHQALPVFRQKINDAESTEDVKKFFFQTVEGIFSEAFDGEVRLEFEDLELNPDQPPHFKLARGLQSRPLFTQVWGDSDLPNIMERLATTAGHHYRRLEKHPEKTDSKIRM